MRDSVTSERLRAGQREIVLLLAAFMALNAFAIDTMLPALPQIGADLGVTRDNERQLVILAYMFGFGASQMLWGPLADRFGRKPVLAGGVSLYFLFATVAAAAQDFTLMIVARFLMGASGAVSRVLVNAIVRDLFEGEAMARVMSLTMMVFMVVPVLAPSVGQLILFFGDWRLIFYGLAGYGLAVLVWGWLRLPETLNPDYRRKLEFGIVGQAVLIALRDRLSLGYTMALTAVFTALTAYLASIQQIVSVTFERPGAIGIVFGAIAAPMSIASWGNSRIVERYGLRNVSHWGLIGFLMVSLAHLLVAWWMVEPLWLFVLFQAASFVFFAFTTANFGTLAMTNMAKVAGTAASVQGTFGTVGAAALGLVIGQAYDGTQIPYLAGMALAAVAALLVVLVTERGRLFSHGPKRSPGATPERCPGPEGS
ncbi:multidrug effflux MFS transporter [Sphingomicrobium lutaoense]|uniref:DHA1 family bicyclomycin/chloramphenicol resistance-like MFS transporter n=1 Tax=Sphingomicrobium lutaoense TaxID=515949 RepID=A0A839Z4Q1_9SPHN|nr:multidrug effflux MFS transporter [Sphingomicrobium lutaoense]MBB3763634.1 DHA1 family bicyclomycin/chloramphenicol resistance-like MFS transporter [Sphingomicrobium lutaoense]